MIETERLILRPWEDRDLPVLQAHTGDPEVMRYLLPIAGDAQLQAHIGRLKQWHADHGFTFWMVERRSDGAMLGVCGLKPGAPDTPIDGSVEVGWRFGREHWGHGYATEAAQASLAWAWANLPVTQIVSITVPANRASWRVMERLGMTRVDGGDFDHPQVAVDSPLKRHILYTIDRPAA